MMINNQRYFQDNVPKPIIMPGTSSALDEVEELMRIMRKRDYNIIGQMHQTPSKMSILSLLIYFEAHMNTLTKLLKNSFVPQEITVGHFEIVSANKSIGNGFGFTDFDIPLEWHNHNKALHISME